MTPGDWSILPWVLLYLAAVLGASEVMHAVGAWSSTTGRRVVHLAVGSAAAAAPVVFDTPWPLLVLAALFAPFNLVAGRRRWLRGMHDVARRTDGTATFALAVLFAAWAAWVLDPARVPAMQAALVVLALGDPLAAWAGERRGGRTRYRAGGDERSLVGSAVFFTVALVGIGGTSVVTGYPVGASAPATIALVGIAALWATVAEAVGRSGWDNLWIVVAIVFVVGFVPEDPRGLDRLLTATPVSLALAATTLRLRLLDAGGAWGAALLCLTIVLFGGWGLLLPGAIFFVLSSLLSRVGRGVKDGLAVRPEKSGPRDLVQVAANGGVAWLVLAAGMLAGDVGQGWVVAAFCGAFAAAAADTWSTEIGSLWGRSPRMVTTGRRVEAGTSGAVTLTGLLASVAGSASVAGVSWLLGAPFIAILAAGVAGGLVDSLAGALLQGAWPGEGSLVEARQAGTAPVKGLAWVDNDTVNLLCTAAGAILAAALA